MKLSNFNSLAEAQAYSETSGKMMSPDLMLSYLTMFGHVSILDNPINDETKALKHAFNFGSEFNLIKGHPSNIQSMLQIMVDAGDISVPFQQAVIAYANPTIQPFATSTQLEFNQANQIYTSKTIQYTGRNLRLRLNTTLPTDCMATLWITETGFLQENTGRPVHLSSIGNYKLNLSGIAQGALEVRVPYLNADFVVEAY